MVCGWGSGGVQLLGFEDELNKALLALWGLGDLHEIPRI
jgi:hypothetical protein